MSQRLQMRCPRCSVEMPPVVLDGQFLVCMSCEARYRVAVDRATGRTGLVALDESQGPEPLNLPRGSIRALVTLALAFTCWRLIQFHRPVPPGLLTLMATTVGYYFAMRKGLRASQSRILDAESKTPEPLFLPAGVIRTALMAGFALSGWWLFRQGRLFAPEFIEFYAIFGGLVTGFLFSRFMAGVRAPAAHAAVGHVKGIFVLASTAWMSWMLLGDHAPPHPGVMLLLPAVTSFYFGSR
jgi:hypothetical protein